MLFSDRSLWTMVHGLVFSGGAILFLAIALYSLRAMARPSGAIVPARHADHLAWGAILGSACLWLAVLGGTYVVFPMYRETPPDGVASLAAYPRALLMASDDSRWLHSFGMEIKEHLPWIAAMLSTAAAYIAWRHRPTLLADAPLRTVTASLLSISLACVASVALLGVFVNKVAPLW